MASLKPPLPGESAAAYHRRITAADGVPEAVVVEVEHPFWKGLGDIVKRWQTMMGIVVIVGASSVSTLKIDALMGRVAAANIKLEKLDQVVTKEDLQKELNNRLGQMEQRCAERAVDGAVSMLTSKDVVASCPILTVRGMSSKPCQIQRVKPRE